MTDKERMNKLAEHYERRAPFLEVEDRTSRPGSREWCVGCRTKTMDRLCPSCHRLVASVLARTADEEQLADRIVKKLFVYKPSDATMRAEFYFGLGRHVMSPSELKAEILSVLRDSQRQGA